MGSNVRRMEYGTEELIPFLLLRIPKALAVFLP
jgi:hypothetical protein